MNFVRNYAIEAFRYYAIIGEPTEEEYIKSIRDRAKRQVVSVRNTLSDETLEKMEQIERDHEAEMRDVIAVINTFKRLSVLRQGRNVKRAVKEVYMHPDFIMCNKKGIISRNVSRLSIAYPCGERSIYRWLDMAVEIFAEERGLRVYRKVARKQCIY
jgi:hypothetical protein